MNSTVAVATLIGLSLGAVYPLCLWCNRKAEIPRFYHLHLAVGSGLIGISMLWYFEVGLQLRLSGLVWLSALSATTAFYWNRSRFQILIVAIPSVFGLIVNYQVVEIIVFPEIMVFFAQIIGAALLGLPILMTGNLSKSHDNYASIIVAGNILRTMLVLLGIRTVWIVFSLFWGPVSRLPEMVNWLEFFSSLEGYIPAAAIFLGILIPFSTLTLVHFYLNRQYYQLALKLLYPLVVSMLLAEILFKYYLFQYGIVL